VDNWSVYVVDGFGYAQPSGGSINKAVTCSLSVVEGNALGKNNLDERQK